MTASLSSAPVFEFEEIFILSYPFKKSKIPCRIKVNQTHHPGGNSLVSFS